MALLLAVASPAAAEPLRVFKDCDVCPEMVELPMGEFMIGGPEDEYPLALVFYDGAVRPATTEHPSIKTDEGPQHEVDIDIPFAIGKNEVTYGEWMACVADSGCGGYVPTRRIPPVVSITAVERSLTDDRFGSPSYRSMVAEAFANDDDLQLTDDFPVLYVSYNDAQLYVEWMNRKLGINSYRLPTEAEWEYAARAGTTSRFAQGDDVTSAEVNFSGEDSEYMLDRPFPDFVSRGFPVPVDELDAANAWGIRHMSGNVAEVTQSCHAERYAGWTTSSDWLSKGGAGTCKRSYRGGSYSLHIGNARVAWRSPGNEDRRSQTTGFRVVKELEPES
ncbi:formylglycine-generating enzyme family protein [Tabrizicola piscis]|uniref:formylglycine-generating enzyme family protein n=1 Tax=Tabrizicola piscis TaxID=2494374 RepID=UPI0013DE084C|nr:formylglycine-generating enzyme family protein [Tabrizicola piscis]